MRFVELPIAGAFEIVLDPHMDNRGHFMRTFSVSEFAGHGLETEFVERSLSYNRRSGTLRGLHFQAAPFAESKLVRCSRGAAFDVIVDLRRGSPSFGVWHGIEISADNHRMVYIPRGLAHGFQTLCDETEMDYMITPVYHPASSGGIRFDDPDLAIDWPLPVQCISARDLALPPLSALI